MKAAPSTVHDGHVAVVVDPGSYGPDGIESEGFLDEVRRIARRRTGGGESLAIPIRAKLWPRMMHRVKDSHQAQGLGGASAVSL